MTYIYYNALTEIDEEIDNFIDKINKQFLLPIMIIHKRCAKTLPENEFSSHCLVFHNENGWMTEKLFMLFMNSVVLNLKIPKII